MRPLLVLAVLLTAPAAVRAYPGDELVDGAGHYQFDETWFAEHPAVTEERVIAVIEQLAAACLEGRTACEAFDQASAKRDRQALDRLDLLLEMLEQVGTDRSLPLLWRLDARGVWTAPARERIFTRRLGPQLPALRASCQAPKKERVVAAAGLLGDFLVIDRHGERFVARPLSAAERADLAYFLVAVEHAKAPVGRGEGEIRATRDARATTPNPAREAAWAQMTAARADGDVAGVERGARAYLESLGFPGPIREADEDAEGWGGARYSDVLRELAAALEAQQKYSEAADAYRRANPGGGMCGTGSSSKWEAQIFGTIRTSELAGRCDEVVAERLLDVERLWQDPSFSGATELSARGYDLARLYRGALLTRNRADPKVIAEALANAPAKLAARARARLQTRGPENWENRLFAAEGFADTSGRDALDTLSTLLEVGDDDLRRRVVRALGILGTEAVRDPCRANAPWPFTMSSEWSRPVRQLNEKCESKLSARQTERIVAAIARCVASNDVALRAASAEALGRLGTDLGRRILVGLGNDPAKDGERCDGSGCAPVYPVREKAAEALRQIEKREEQRRE